MANRSCARKASERKSVRRVELARAAMLFFLNNSAPVAQLDRASGYEPEGREFESPRAHHYQTSESCTLAGSGYPYACCQFPYHFTQRHFFFSLAVLRNKVKNRTP